MSIVTLNQDLQQFPFLDKFVESMHHINGHEIVTSEIDTLSLVFFFNLYIKTCKNLKKNKRDMTIDNIKECMKNLYVVHLETTTVKESLVSQNMSLKITNS
jgi:hypothetical protein